MVYDARIILDAVQRYGQACFEHDCSEAAAMFGEVTRMVTDHTLTPSFGHDETAAPSEEGAAVTVLT